jgi:vancomycin resistance protein YoaR
MADSTKLITRIILLMSVAVILTLLLVSLVLAKRDAAIYPSNVLVGGVSVAGLGHEEASNLLATSLPASYGGKLLLQLPSKQLSIPFTEVGITYDIPGTLANIDVSLHYKGIGIFQHSIARGSTREIPPTFNWNQTLIKEKLTELKNSMDLPAVNARIFYKNDHLEYTGHKNGYSIDIATSLNEINNSLQKGLLGPIPLITNEIYPQVKLEDIKEVKDMLGVSMSKVNKPQADLQPLVETLNGSIIMPAEHFALALSTEKMKPDRSTLTLINNVLYQAISQAGLTPADDQLSFNNTLQHPILITAVIDRNNLIVKVFGCQTEAGKEIMIITEKEEIPPQVQIKVAKELSSQQQVVVQEGQSGYINRSYRIVKIHGDEIEKTVLSEEHTPGLNTIIAVGPGNIKK